MNPLLPVILGVSLLMPIAAADTSAVTDDMRAAYDAECREQLGYTEEQFTYGIFLENLRECVSEKVRAVLRREDLEKLAETKRKTVDRITESYKRRVAPKRLTKRTMPGSGGLSTDDRRKLQQSKRDFRSIRAKKRLRMEQLEQQEDAGATE